MRYVVDYGDGLTEELAAGVYDGLQFWNDDEPVLFIAEATGDLPLDPQAPASWEYLLPEECWNFEVVDIDVQCDAITFTNIVDADIYVLYGSEGEAEPDGEFGLAPSESRRVTTDRNLVLYIAFGENEDLFEIGEVRVPQNCGDDDSAGHPTTAPAAGVVGGDGGSPLAPALLAGALLAGAALRLRGSLES